MGNEEITRTDSREDRIRQVMREGVYSEKKEVGKGKIRVEGKREC